MTGQTGEQRNRTLNTGNRQSILFLKNGEQRFEALIDALHGRGYGVDAVSAAEAAERLAGRSYRAVIADLSRDDIDGADLLCSTAARSPDSLFIAIAGLDREDEARKLVDAGAAAYFIPPFDAADLVSIIDNAASQPAAPGRQAGFCGIVGSSPLIATVIDLIRKVADVSSTVLVTGESGTGKELVARAIHSNSRRAAEPFVVVHCGAIPDSLLESELFGHERGAFTGAYSQKQGLFQSARGGTVFLDEIGEVTPATQVKLLRVLESGMVRPVGGTRDVQVGVRVIAATNRDLKEAVRRGNFREDLFYRLNVFPIHVPSLRERKGDIAVLTRHFLEQIGRDGAARPVEIDPAAMKLLIEYSWPGNIRELENVIERAAILSSGGPITEEYLPREIHAAVSRPANRGIYDLPFKTARSAFERDYVEHVLSRCEGNVARAARMAGMSRAYFYEVLSRYGVRAR